MRSIFAIIIGSVLAACASDPAPREFTLPTAPDAIYGFQVDTLAPGVYALNQGDEFHIQPRGNVEVIEQARGIVLVDSGGSPAGAEQVIAFVRQLSTKPVTAIILTHWHGDHTLGVSRLLQEWPEALVISTGPTHDMLTSPDADRFMPGDNTQANAAYMADIRGGIESLSEAAQNQDLADADRIGFAQAAREYGQFGREMTNARRMAPTEVFDQRLTLADRQRPIEVMFLGRANTAGDAIVWLPRQRVVITGDVVVAPIPYGFNSYPGEWIEVLNQIKALDFAVLAPGHGRPMHDTAYVDRLIGMLTVVRDQAAPLAATDIAPDAAGGQVDLDAARDTFAGEDRWLRRWFRDYWRDPIASSALREARGEPIIQGAS
jgi:glyoxylase-like metal-dependent hydrolase (beta-lactamase superfamily II)